MPRIMNYDICELALTFALLPPPLGCNFCLGGGGEKEEDGESVEELECLPQMTLAATMTEEGEEH